MKLDLKFVCQSWLQLSNRPDDFSFLVDFSYICGS